MRTHAPRRKATAFSTTLFARPRYSRRMTVFLQIEGTAIVDIPSLYAEINRIFMADADWQLGPSLDALDDLLYGGHGALAGHESATVVWRDIDHSREALGLETTRAWLEDKLRQPGTFNAETIGRQLDALQRGEGQTYFDIVMEIFASHPDITLVQA